ncbi:uncharacterized protein [Chironomus tepperi]|uniref:uncharacterized protein n=1 Tax=Chironomus tepperi TaxID=113505 RepID=UPI00391F495B
MWNNKFVIIVAVLCLWNCNAVHGQCTINVNGGLGEPQPILIHPDSTNFYEPVDVDGIIRLGLNSQIELYCQTGFASPATTETLIKVTCAAGNLFTWSGFSLTFNNFICRAYPTPQQIRTGANCYNNALLVKIGYQVDSSRFLTVFEVCHDDRTEETYYSKHRFSPASSRFQSGFTRRSWMQGNFFGSKNVDNLYTKHTQRATIGQILNCQPCADNYIHPTNDFFMARGHIAAFVDFIFGNQQSATMAFLNVAPQWQRFNAQNWERIEDATRRLAATRQLDLDVYTGTFGRLRLRDADRVRHDIYLSINGTNQIPAPKLFYKILVNNADNSGIVMIGVNNIYLEQADLYEYIICHDISHQITWPISWVRNDTQRGYSYACSVSDFLRVVPHHSLSVSRLLIFRGQCTINVNGDLGEPQPILIHPDSTNFYEPVDVDGIIRLGLNSQIELYCETGFTSPAITETLIKVTCAAGNLFTWSGYSLTFNNFICRAYPTPQDIKTGARCYNSALLVKVGYQVDADRFLTVFEVCHDDRTEETYYSKHRFSPANSRFQSGFDRTNWTKGNFFGSKNVDYLYRRDTQRVTIAKILDCQPCADDYIHPTNDFFLSRGHLAAKADFIFGNQQSATFFFINAAPQWQRFNALNWMYIEDATRRLAATRQLDLDVYTGTFGRLRLRDADRVQHDIYLSINGTNQIPAPKLYYKILVNNADNSGIVMIGVNNIYLEQADLYEYIICHDISYQITWPISWVRNDTQRGYSYACSVPDFLRVVPHHSLSVTGLLI